MNNLRNLRNLILLVALEILPNLSQIPVVPPLQFKCPRDSPKIRTDVGTYCGRREKVVWPGKRTTHVDIFYGQFH